MKRVTLYIDPKDPYCVEIEKFLRRFDIILKVHDLRSNPLTIPQLSNLLGYNEPEHFFNPNGKSAKFKGLDTSLTNRREVLEIIAEDNTLLKTPIVVSGRLMSIGYDRRTILRMLQLKDEETEAGFQAESAASR